MYLRTVRGETRIFSFTSSSLAIRSSPHSGFSCAILRINARNSAGIGGRPALHLPRQKSCHPSRCQRIMVAGQTRTTASRQSKSLVNSARLIRVNASTLRGLTPRSKYLASCRRRTKFSARIALDERQNNNPSLKISENNPLAICANLFMRSSCQIPTSSAASDFSNSYGANYCGVHSAQTGSLDERSSGRYHSRNGSAKNSARRSKGSC